jgi:hypothetical protein
MSDQEQIKNNENARYKVLRYFYDSTKGDTYVMLEESKIINFLVQHHNMMVEEVISALRYLNNENLIECVTLGPSYSITHKGFKEMEWSIKHPEISTDHFSKQTIQQFFIQNSEVTMGDKFEQISNSTIINRSSVENAFNQTKERVNEETADALLEIAEVVEKSNNIAAGSLLNNFMDEVRAKEPDKSKLRQYWDALVSVLPSIATLATACSKIAALFT